MPILPLNERFAAAQSQILDQCRYCTWGMYSIEVYVSNTESGSKNSYQMLQTGQNPLYDYRMQVLLTIPTCDLKSTTQQDRRMQEDHYLKINVAEEPF